MAVLADATGRLLRQDGYPCPEPPKRPDGPPAYTVTVDPGVGCQMLPDEVAEKLRWSAISMRCTTMDQFMEIRGPDGRLDQRVVWFVDQGAGWKLIDDSTGQVRGHGGSGGLRRDEGSERSPAAEAVARHRVVEPPAPVVELGEGLDHHGVLAGHPGDLAERRLAHPLPLLEGTVCEGQARRVARHEADTAEGGGVGQRQGRVRLLGAGQLGLALEGAGGARALASEVCAGERGLGDAPGQQHQVHTVAAAHLEHAPRG